MKRTEIIGGITTFLTMSYIIVVNPSILATAGTGMNFNGVLTATVLLSFSMTLFMGLYAKLPFAVAPGMGINAFFTFGLILGEKIPWPTALGMVFWAGVFFLLISVTPLRENLAKSIPPQIRIGSAVGIGIFLTFIGLKNSGLVVSDPVTFVRMGTWNGPVLLSLVGFFTMIILMMRKSPWAFLVGIFMTTLISMLLGYSSLPETAFAAPDFSSVFFQLDIWGAFKLSLMPAIASILFTDLFDSISTFVGVSKAGGLVDDRGEPLRLRQGLIVDSFATLFAGLFGTSSGTAYIESAAGVEAGARTGLASIVTALCFLPFLFLAPLLSVIPGYATAPVLICVGILMFRSIAEIKLERLEEFVPAFLTIFMIPFTFSITKGLLIGLSAHVTLYALAGRGRELRASAWILGALSIVLLLAGI